MPFRVARRGVSTSTPIVIPSLLVLDPRIPLTLRGFLVSLYAFDRDANLSDLCRLLSATSSQVGNLIESGVLLGYLNYNPDGSASFNDDMLWGPEPDQPPIRVAVERFKKDLCPHLLRLKILVRDKFSCRYCGDPCCTVDHIIPRSAGGTHAESNLVAACVSCNSKKGVNSLEESGMVLREVPQ